MAISRSAHKGIYESPVILYNRVVAFVFYFSPPLNLVLFSENYTVQYVFEDISRYKWDFSQKFEIWIVTAASESKTGLLGARALLCNSPSSFPSNSITDMPLLRNLKIRPRKDSSSAAELVSSHKPHDVWTCSQPQLKGAHKTTKTDLEPAKDSRKLFHLFYF